MAVPTAGRGTQAGTVFLVHDSSEGLAASWSQDDRKRFLPTSPRLWALRGPIAPNNVAQESSIRFKVAPPWQCWWQCPKWQSGFKLRLNSGWVNRKVTTSTAFLKNLVRQVSLYQEKPSLCHHHPATVSDNGTARPSSLLTQANL